MEIQLLSKHWLSLRQIAAEVGCAVNTVRGHLALDAVPKYERKVKRQTKLAPFEDYLRCARTLRIRIRFQQPCCTARSARGYQGGMRQLRAFMRTLRPTPPADPVVRFETAMGEQLQVAIPEHLVPRERVSRARRIVPNSFATA